MSRRCYREAAYGVGATRWEVFRYVLMPYAKRGLLGGSMLGLGRALGETMAVTFVIGNAHRIAMSLLHPAPPFRPACQRIHRSGRQPLICQSVGARADSVRHHLRRAGRGTLLLSSGKAEGYL